MGSVAINYKIIKDQLFDLFTNAIFITKTMFGKEAFNKRLFLFLFCSLVMAYENSDKLLDAKHCYDAAESMRSQIADFPDDAANFEHCRKSTQNKIENSVEDELIKSRRKNKIDDDVGALLDEIKKNGKRSRF